MRIENRFKQNKNSYIYSIKINENIPHQLNLFHTLIHISK